MSVLEAWDAKGRQNESFDLIVDRINFLVENDEPLVLTAFTCSTIDANQMFGKTPWEYVSLDPIGNNLTDDIERFVQLVQELQSFYENTRLRIVIGNTDPYYIYTQQFGAFEQNKAELWKRFSERWARYRDILDVWVKDRAQSLSVEIVSWYEFEKAVERSEGISFEAEYQDVLNEIDRYAKASDMDWEFEKLRRQFITGGYFAGLERPNDEMLRDWVRRKFAEYAVQALWIRQFMPNALLIQNEKPSDLRTAMYQPLVRERCNEAFPILYVCGVDNEGYQ